MKLTAAQIKKANKRINKKYPGLRIKFSEGVHSTHVIYDFLEFIEKPTEEQEYLFGFFRSLLATETRFDDLYYSL